MVDPSLENPYARFAVQILQVMGVGCSPAAAAVSPAQPSRVGEAVSDPATRAAERSDMGRPFTVEGSPRVAAATARAGWGAPLHPELEGLDSETRGALAEEWTRVALAEHASIASFARFALELLSIGAPADLVADAQRAMGDEVRHAEIGFGLASAYQGSSVGPSAFPCLDPSERHDDLIAVTRAVVREAAISETIAALTAGQAARSAEDPVVRRALEEIARDESEHAALAWRYLAWALGQGEEEIHRAVEEELEASVRELKEDAPDSEEITNPVGKYGFLSPTRRRAIARRGLGEVIVPCARELLTASRWLVSRRRASRSQARRGVGLRA